MPHDLTALRIVEIGPAGHFKAVFPKQTQFFKTEVSQQPRDQLLQKSPSSLIELARVLAADDYDLIVCEPSSRSPWHWQTLSRLLFSRRVASNLRQPLRPFGPQLLRTFRKKPLAVVDFADTPYIERDNFFLMDRASLYFKRELPIDEWRLMTKTGSDTQPSRRFRKKLAFRTRLAKLRPLPLGLPSGCEPDLPTDIPSKDIDIFFSGIVEGIPARERALAELSVLRQEGYVIDIPGQPLPRNEFYRRCSRAWLTLSPEGLGWDCFRHYEAPACGSVPLISQSTTRRYAPLLDGEHALFYSSEPGLLAAQARKALAEKPRLLAIAQAGRAHVLANHRQEAILRYVIETTLEHIGHSPG